MLVGTVCLGMGNRMAQPRFCAKPTLFEPNPKASTLAQNCQKASTIGKSALAIGGVVFSVGYLEDHLGYSLAGTICAGAGAATWVTAKVVEKTAEALANVQRYFKTTILHKPE